MLDSLYPPQQDTPEQQARAQAILNTPGSLGPDPGVLGRLAYGIGTAPEGLAQSLANTTSNLGAILGANPYSQPVQPSNPLPPASGFGEQAADFIGSAIPTLAQIAGTEGLSAAATEGAIPRIAQYLGASEEAIPQIASVANRVINTAAGFGSAGLAQDPTTGAEQAGEGAASGLITSLLPRTSPLRLAASAALGIGSKMFFDRNNPQPNPQGITPGDISGLAIGASTALLGKPFVTSHLPGEIPTKVATPSDNIHAAFTNSAPGFVDQTGNINDAFGRTPESYTPPQSIEQQIGAMPTVQGATQVPPPADIYGAFGQSAPTPLTPDAPPSIQAILGARSSSVTEGGLTDTQQPSPTQLGMPESTSPVTQSSPSLQPLQVPLQDTSAGPALQTLADNAPKYYTINKDTGEVINQTTDAYENYDATQQAHAAGQNVTIGYGDPTQDYYHADQIAARRADPYATAVEDKTTAPVQPDQSIQPPADLQSLQNASQGGASAPVPPPSDSFAQSINNIAAKAPSSEKFGERVPLSYVYQQALDQGLVKDKADFQQQMMQNQTKGNINLSRNDIQTKFMDTRRVASEIGDNLSTYHFITAPKEIQNRIKLPSTSGNESFAQSINNITANAPQGARFGSQKVNIDYVYNQALKQGLVSTRDEFEQKLLQNFRQGGFALSRNDFATPEMQKTLAKSVLQQGNETFHYVLDQGKGVKAAGGGMKSQFATEGGYTNDALSQAMGRTAIGALAGGALGGTTDDPDSHQHMLEGAFGGALLGLLGPSVLRAAVEHEALAKTIKPEDINKPLNEVKATTTQGTPNLSIANLIAKSQLAVKLSNESAGSVASLKDKAVAKFADLFGLDRGPAFNRLLGQSTGAVTEHVGNIQNAFRKIATIAPSEDQKALMNKFLDGDQSLPKDKFVQQMSVDSNGKALADFATVARDSMDGIQQILSQGVGSDNKTKMILDSRGKYLTRTFGLFVNGQAPSESAINNLADQIFKGKLWGDAPMGQIQDGLRQYAREVITDKTQFAPTPDSFAGKRINQTLFKERQPLTDEWKQFLGEITDPRQRVALTTMKLRPMAEASNFMAQVANGAARSDEGLKYVFPDHGTWTAEKERVLQQLQTLKQAGDSGSTVRPPSVTDTPERLNQQLLKLQQYEYVSPRAVNGDLQNKYVHPAVYDVMNGWDQAKKVDSGYTRAMVGINQFMKSQTTYRNPMSIVRQLISTPFFLQVGRSTPDSIRAAWNALIDHSDPMYGEGVRMGILHADSVTGDTLRDIKSVDGGLTGLNNPDAAAGFMGRIDAALAKANAYGKMADSTMANAFRFPDQLVRLSSYIAAKTRAADSMKLALDHPNVMNAAVEHANRYTMNFNLLPKATLGARNVPFVNLFIGYASEMGRILKNLGSDVIQGDGASRMNAIASLGTMAVLPEVVQKLSEANLSQKDQQDWQKVKDGMPAYMKDRYMFVSGRDKQTGKFRVYDFSNPLPADQFQQTIRALVDGRPLDAVKNNPVVGWDNNPALNIASSFLTGKDRFTDRELRGPGDYLATVAKEAGGPLVPGGSISRNATLAGIWPVGEHAEGGGQLVNKQGKSLSALDFWTPIATTIKAENIDLNQIQRGVVSDYKQNVANEIAYYNDVAKSNVSNDVKQRAAQRAQAALQQLQNQVKTQLGISN